MVLGSPDMSVGRERMRSDHEEFNLVGVERG